MKKKQLEAATRQAADWNAAHEVGAKVRAYKVKGMEDQSFETTTRSEAFVAESGDVVVFLKGVSGFYALDNVKAL